MLRFNHLVLFVFVINFLNSQIVDSQKLPWTNKCEQAQSEAEMGICLFSSCKEANSYFDKVYDSLYRKVQLEYKKYDKGSVQFEILSKYISYLPRLKKSLSENALCLSELETAAEISGSGYEIFKNERYLKVIENNIMLLKSLESELPSFN
jgi:hypothetical protein